MARNKKEYDLEEVEQIIGKYVEETKVSKISFHGIAIYALELYEKGEITNEYKSSFWRHETQHGRQIVDKWNETLLTQMKKNEDINDIGFYETSVLLSSYKINPTQVIEKKLEMNQKNGEKLALKSKLLEEEK